MIVVVALHVVPAAAFALLHGAQFYQWRGILIFSALCLFTGNLFENLGIRTGFPFGHYHFTALMGPAIWGVPALASQKRATSVSCGVRTVLSTRPKSLTSLKPAV